MAISYSSSGFQGSLFPEADEYALEHASFRRVVSVLEDAAPYGSDEAKVLGCSMKRPGDVAQALAPLLAHQAVEVFSAVLLDARHKAIGYAEVSRGTINMAPVHPREVFGPAVRLGAAAIIVAHNHPSGDPTPSAEDFAVTRRLKEAGDILGIPVLDHLVIGSNAARFSSLRESAEWPTS